MRESQTTCKTLRQLDPNMLPVGSVLPGAIRDATGEVLLRAGWKLRSGDIGALLRRADKGLFGGEAWALGCILDEPTPSVADGTSVSRPSPKKRSSNGETYVDKPKASLVAISLEKIKPGSQLTSGLFSKEGILLLGQGTEVTPHFLDRLRRHGIYEVHVDTAVRADLMHSDATEQGSDDTATREDQCAPANPRILTPDEVKQSRTIVDLERIARRRSYSDLALKNRPGPRTHLPLSDYREETRRAKELYNQTVEQVGDILEDAAKGRNTSISGARSLLSEFAEMTALDDALLPAVVSLWNSPGDYIFQHSVNVSLLSMAAAAGKGIAPDDIKEIGVGALLQDIGMLQLPEDLRNAPRALTDVERELVQQHPFYSVAALEKVDGVSGISMMIAYQSHERPDSSGYPRGHHGTFIHPYARIVAAADSYVAVCSHRAYREPLSPYKGMEFLLRECHQNHLDNDVIRSFLDCMSLFPVGTFVRLSDGQSAKVLRSNPGMHTRPVVLPLCADGFESDEELDLSKILDLHVVETFREHPSIVT